ncbi:MAG: thiamine phosphate synthase [Gammaproteobacteria bacterium]|nr:thiamine phosphate synthase [Gammaproteobacteria bacterium]MCW8840395.1 thiamine phosphate synthase [Gammaproteobacteria bacterium]MCW8928122.1 thiamine phosphate synthase [Gammaproteobacteria bacterium]MCW8957612.1 thiamine phosphate synthase [Gammaproteobacteria bacterium]MCW8972983.1 thiamine phosphate synthase [Gammaproteobacteria bacterium]
MTAVPHGLYAITDSKLLSPEQMVEAVALAIQGGAVMIQYRDKGDDVMRRQWEASDLNNMCRPLGVPLIINDDVELAVQVMAKGVHLGKDDHDIAAARARLGDNAIIGVSCYNDLQRAIEAEQAGADYVAFGSFHPSPTKPDALKAEVELLRQAKQQLAIPVVAIGGITADNGAPLVEAGADLLAVINGIFGQADIRGAAESISKLFETH